MFGRSYMGTAQFLAAMAAPPSLRAIFPQMAMQDLYSFIYSGGIFRHDFARQWSRDVRALDTTATHVRVDHDPVGLLSRTARRRHRRNRDFFEMFRALPFRDSVDARTGSSPYLSPARSYEKLRTSARSLPVYQVAGWFDPFVRDAFVSFSNLPEPKRLVVGPWAHQGTAGIDLGDEHTRWYQQWINGTPSGIADEPPLWYYTMGASQGTRWHPASQWPILEAEPTCFYFGSGPIGSVRSVNDGLLRREPPGDDHVDEYVVDTSTTSGPATRWTNAYGGPYRYPDMRTNDEKGLTYTTHTFGRDLQVTGHPLAHLWVTSSAEDGDFFAYLEDVDRDGASRYVSEGALRASHRALSEPPVPLVGLPYHRSFLSDLAPLPRDPVELAFDLFPISWVFAAGHRIRVTITCADRDNALTPTQASPPRVRLHRSPAHPSRLVLPVVV